MKKCQLNNSESIRYRLLAQFRGDLLKIEDSQEQCDFTIAARKLVGQPLMIKQFSAEDACTIGFIAGMQNI